jgi:hypothetical protein
MELRKALASCALAALAAGCTVEPAMPLATVHVPPPVVVGPAPFLVAPAYHKPHPGRGWGHHKHGHRH